MNFTKLLLELNADLDLKGWVEIAGRYPVSPIELIPILQQKFGSNEALRDLMKLVFDKDPTELMELPVTGIELMGNVWFAKL